MKSFHNKTATSALVGIYTLLLIVFIFSSLYIGQAIFIPLTLSILLTFLLSPLVSRLERYIGRPFSVFLVVLMISTGLGAAGYILSQEFVDLVAKIPNYKKNIEYKLHAFDIPENNPFSRLIETIDNLKKEFPGLNNGVNSNKNLKADANQIPIQVVETNSRFTQAAQFFLGVTLSFSFTLGLVLILVIFMLFNRENLKGRIIKLIGQGNIGPTTRAMDEAGKGVFYYILMQLLINFAYGLFIFIGLYLIGIPNPGLWGGLIMILRFIPYLGVWISAAIPVLLSFIISTSWVTPILTISLYLILDLISSNLVEPLVYEASVGISSLAFIITAVFWTLLWGPIGLILATPISVCLIVIGRHVPQLRALSMLLSNEQPLSTQEECYHLLLRDDVYGVIKVIDNFLKDNTLGKLCDTVFIPILIAAEYDYHKDSIDQEEKELVFERIKEIIQELSNRPIILKLTQSEPGEELPDKIPVLCLPNKMEEDEIIGIMLGLVLDKNYVIEIIERNQPLPKIFEYIEASDANQLFLSVTFSSMLLSASFLCKKIRNRFPELQIIVGLWEYVENKEEAKDKLMQAGVNQIVYSLEDAEGLFNDFLQNN